nr:MAG TPA: helix-turn-helix domain protein [Caudoviricetes sp.]
MSNATRKTAITLVLNESTLSSLSNHKDVDAINATYWAQVTANGDVLTKADRNVYFTISKHAVKYPGVAYLSANSIAKMVECSRATVMRAFKKLRTLNMIEILNAKRKSDNRQTANILRMLPVAVNEVAANATVEQGKIEAIDSSNTETPDNNASIEKAVSNQAKSNVESKSLEGNATQDATQGNGENDTPLNSFSLSSSKAPKDLKAFEGATARECGALDAFNVPVELQRALVKLPITDAKKFELLNSNDSRSIATYANNALSAEFPALMRNFDVLKYVAMIESAAVRTAFVAKRKPIRNLVAYFLRTFVELLRADLVEMAVELTLDAVEEAFEAQECYVSVAEETAAMWAPKCAQVVVNGVMERVDAMDQGIA